MKTMRLLFVSLALILGVSMANAQKQGDMGIGANLLMGFGDDYTNVGIGAKFQWFAADNLRIEPSVNYFFKKDYIDMWDLCVNVHYLFQVADKFYLYPLAGIGVQGVSFSAFGFSDSTTDFAVNVGAGGEYQLNDAWALNLEYKYRIVKDWDRSLLSLGASYKF